MLIRLFDIDESGSISVNELRDVLKAMGYNPSEMEVTQIMNQVKTSFGKLSERLNSNKLRGMPQLRWVFFFNRICTGRF